MLYVGTILFLIIGQKYKTKIKTAVFFVPNIKCYYFIVCLNNV